MKFFKKLFSLIFLETKTQAELFSIMNKVKNNLRKLPKSILIELEYENVIPSTLANFLE